MGNKVLVKDSTSKDLTTQDITLLKSVTKLSEQEIRNTHAEFLNEFPSGRMDKKGFIQYYEQVKDPNDKNSILCDHVFAVFDRDHDGTIDFHEFVLTVAAGYPGDLHSHLSYVFDMCDVSGDGQLDFQEIASFLKTAMIIAGKSEAATDQNARNTATGVYRILGISTSKKLTKEQFVEGCKKDNNLRGLFGGGH